MNSDWQPSATRQTLQARAKVVRKIREWFYQKNILEVDTPVLVSGATTDPHIDSFQTGQHVLRTSSEFHQKRLLAAGVGDNYELGKVFRIDESGRFHNPEFTMLEWYRCGIDHHTLIDEVAQLLDWLHPAASPSFSKVSYRDLWLEVAEVDIATCTIDAIEQCFIKRGIELPETAGSHLDELLDLGMGTFIAESMPVNTYICVYHYPGSQASLARLQDSGSSFPYACRFEIFYGKVELANGYYELSDSAEQQQRFEADNRVRVGIGKPVMPVDYKLIAALEHGLPDCAGVAVGLDRLMMILLDDIDSISDTLSFSWPRA